MRTGWMWCVAWIAALALVAGCAGSGARSQAPGAIAIAVTEKGFEPAQVEVAQGKPVTLTVTRRTDKTCAKEFVMEAQNIHEKLPLDQPVEITFTPTAVGELRFACGMDMISGKVVVR